MTDANDMPWQTRLREGAEALESDPASFVAGYVKALDDNVRLRTIVDKLTADLARTEAMAKIAKETADRNWNDRDGLISRAAQFQSERDAASRRAAIAEKQLKAVNDAIEKIIGDQYKDEFPGVGLVCALLKAKIVELPEAGESQGHIDSAHHPQLNRVKGAK